MLSHDNVTWSARTAAQIGEITEVRAKHKGLILSVYSLQMESQVSFLPLSHIAAQMSDIFSPCISGFVVNIAQPDALKGTLKDTLLVYTCRSHPRLMMVLIQEVRPTQLVSVPRVYEKFKDALERQMSDATGIKKFIVETSKVWKDILVIKPFNSCPHFRALVGELKLIV